jgi:hypothetical protein
VIGDGFVPLLLFLMLAHRAPFVDVGAESSPPRIAETTRAQVRPSPQRRATPLHFSSAPG